MKTVLSVMTLLVANFAFAVSVGPVLPPSLTFPSDSSASTASAPAIQYDAAATALKAAKRVNPSNFTAAATATEVANEVVELSDASTGCVMVVTTKLQADGSALISPAGQLSCN